MRTRILSLFSLPESTSPELARKAGTLQFFLILLLLISIPAGIYLVRSSIDPAVTAGLLAALNGLVVLSLLLIRSGRIRLVSILFPYSAWVILTLSAYLIFEDVNSPPVDGYILIILAGGLFLDWRHGFTLIGLSLGSIAGLLIIGGLDGEAAQVGAMPGLRAFVFYLIIYILAAALVHATTNRIQAALQRARSNEEVLEERNRELEQMRASLEARVEERTEEILRQKNFLQTLVDVSPIAIVSLDSDYRISAWNEAFETMFGYGAGELEGSLLDSLITDTQSRQEAELLTSAVAHGEGIRQLAVRHRKDGRPLQVEVFGVPVVMGGEQIGLLGLYNDITDRVMAEQALRESETQNRALFSNIADPVLIFDQETHKLLDANPAAVERYGYSRDEFLELTPFDLHPPEEAERLAGDIAERMSSSPEIYTHITRSGQRMTVEIRTAELEYRGRPAWIIFVQDISERAASERALRDSEEKLRSIIEQSYDSILLTDEDGVITVWNQAQEALTGMPADEVMGRPIGEVDKFIHRMMQSRRGGDGRSREGREAVISGGVEAASTEPREWEILQPDGTRRYAQSVVFPVETGSGFLAGAITRDITERKQIEQRFEYLATHDWLTNLPNRSLFYDRLNHALSLAGREGNQVAVMFLDLDGFKAVNDAFGHARGDELLKEVANRLRNCLRGSDTVARLGGDEFTFVLENITSRDSVTTVVEKIHDCLSKRFLVDGNEFGISASIGISMFPQDAYLPELLLKFADQAMYQAKQHGKNHYRFYS